MKFGLTRGVIGSKAFQPITAETYEAITVAKSGLLEVLFLEEKFDVLIENYLELETTLLVATARLMITRDGEYPDFQLMRNEFNRRFLNLLSACRAYIDHSKHHVSQIFTGAPTLIANHKADFSKQYDTLLGYRVMEALRNYVQHRGSPVHNIMFHSGWKDGAIPNHLVYAVTPSLEPFRIEDDGKFKAEVLAELKAIGTDIDLKPLIREYVTGLWNAHHALRLELAGKVNAWEETHSAAIETFKTTFPDEELIGLAAVKVNDNGTYSDDIPIFDDFIDYRKYLAAKNDHLQNLAQRYVSGQVIQQNT